jgi:hypothetical protein
VTAHAFELIGREGTKAMRGIEFDLCQWLRAFASRLF